MREKRFSHFRTHDFVIWPFDLKFALPVKHDQGHVFTELEVSAAFLIWVNRRHWTDWLTEDGQTDGYNT